MKNTIKVKSRIFYSFFIFYTIAILCYYSSSTIGVLIEQPITLFQHSENKYFGNKQSKMQFYNEGIDRLKKRQINIDTQSLILELASSFDDIPFTRNVSSQERNFHPDSFKIIYALKPNVNFEQKIRTAWQFAMDSSIRSHLSELKRQSDDAKKIIYTLLIINILFVSTASLKNINTK